MVALPVEVTLTAPEDPSPYPLAGHSFVRLTCVCTLIFAVWLLAGNGRFAWLPAAPLCVSWARIMWRRRKRRLYERMDSYMAQLEPVLRAPCLWGESHGWDPWFAVASDDRAHGLRELRLHVTLLPFSNTAKVRVSETARRPRPGPRSSGTGREEWSA